MDISATTLDNPLAELTKSEHMYIPPSNSSIPRYIFLWEMYKNAQGNTICNGQKIPKCLLTAEWINKLLFSHQLNMIQH